MAVSRRSGGGSQKHGSHHKNMKLVRGKKKVSTTHRGTTVGKKTFGKSKHKNSRSLTHP